MSEFELEMRQAAMGDVAVVQLEGDLDLTNASDLERRLEHVAGGVAGLVLDLDRVTFLDSAALHTLFRLGRSLRAEGKAYAVALAPSSRVARTVQLVRLDQAAVVAPTREEALARIPS